MAVIKTENSNVIWYTTDDFQSLEPVDIFGKESVLSVSESDIKNYHCLCRSEYLYDGEAAVKMKITADDYYKLYINGIYVTEGPAPSYHNSRFYNEIEITPFLRRGKNVIAAHVYYQGLINRVWQSGDNRFGLACLVNGGNLLWKYKVCEAFSGHKSGYDTAFSESFDSRLFDESWKEMSFDDSAWALMKSREHDYTFRLQTTKQLSVYTVKPVAVMGNVYDFGSEIVGCLKIKAKGKNGVKIVIRCGEELNPDGSVRFDMRCYCKYEELWTLSEGESVYENYDYKGFRYVEILSGEAEILSLKAAVRHYPFDENFCIIESNDSALADIFDICKNAVKWGTQESYLDCPTREKGQYLGDALITAHSHLLLTGDNSLLRKAIDDFARTSEICPGLMAVSSASLMQEIADYSLLFGELLLLEYKFSGDREFLGKYYPIAKNVILYFREYENERGLICGVTEKWNLVDWPENLRDGYDFPLTRPITSKEPHCVLNAYYLGAIKTLNKIEKLLGLDLSFSFDEVNSAFQSVFFDGMLYRDREEGGHNSLHSNVLPLYFGLVPEKHKKNVIDFILEKGFSCGVYMSYFLLKALTQNGKYAEAYRLIVNESEHGWVNMLREGATCCFEAWGKEQKFNTSLCHPWASAPIGIIVEDLATHKIDNLKIKLISNGGNYALPYYK